MARDGGAGLNTGSGARTVAVVGSRGFTGRALVKALRGTDWTVREYESNRPFLPDVRRPLPEVIVYLASTANPPQAERQPERVDADVACFNELLERLAGRSERPRIILPSSGGTVYDTSVPPPYTERSAVGPISAYGKGKLRMERLLLEHPSESWSPLVLRLANVYGPGQPTGTGQGVVAHWLHAAATGQEAVLIGDESVTRDYVYIDDVVSAYIISMQRPPAERILNIGSGRPTTLGDLASTIQRVVGDNFRLRRQPPRDFDVRHNYLAVDRAIAALDWRPRTRLEDGIARTWKALRAV
jgi:UDP-glucose 4-epimerase